MKSLSARRAWIEIPALPERYRSAQSLSARRAWIEIAWFARSACVKPSLSARRAWIEIPVVPAELTTLVNVALRKESVDRN